MTVVVALRCEDHLAIAADQMASDEEMKFGVSKIFWRRESPLAWGTAGDLGLGEEFSEWFNKQDLKVISDWPSLRDLVADQIASMNGHQRRRIETSGAELEPGNLLDVLFVGYVGQQPEFLHVTRDGLTYFHYTRGFVAIGSGASHASIVKHAIDRLSVIGSAVQPRPPDGFFCWYLALMGSETDPKSGGLPECFTVKSSGIKRVKIDWTPASQSGTDNSEP